MQTHNNHIVSRQGFSLVELSIVLVILGLLTGGILAGQSLIKASELRRVSTDINRYLTATYSFRDKYFSLPGDMANAQSFWGDDTANCNNAATPDGEVCNGNGDGKITAAAGSANGTGEATNFWEHLRMAGFVEGGYNGTANTAAPWLNIGVNLPQISRSGIGINPMAAFTSGGTVNIAGGWYQRGEGNFFQIGMVQSNNTNSNFLWGNAFSGEDSWNIDRKIDDGQPGNGQLIAVRASSSALGATADCTTPTIANGGLIPPDPFDYLLITGSGCGLYMRTTR